MSPVHIKKRAIKPDPRTGKARHRWLVYYRRGGRAFPLEYGGSLPTKQLAEARREQIRGELLAGRDPRLLLARLNAPPGTVTGLEQAWDAFTASRVDVTDDTREGYGDAKKKWLPILGARQDPAAISPAQVIEGLATIGETVSAATAGQYLSTLRMVLDFADVDPNPARSHKVRRPRAARVEKQIPTNAGWFAIRDNLKKRSLLVERLQEACAFRVSEAAAVEWGDIDFIEGMVLIRGTKTAAARRWVPVPPELLDAIADLVPQEDRRSHDRVLRVQSTKVVRYDLERACIAAGAPLIGTHALRHRRISLWIRHGIDEVQIARWAGHSKASESQNTYGHIVLDPRGDEWRGFWLDTYEAAARVPREAPVRHEAADDAV